MLSCVNQNSSPKWKFQTGGQVRSSPFVDSDGIVYFGSYDSSLYAVDQDGNLKWKFQTGDKVNSSPFVDGAGTVYFQLRVV